jgi:hypothetical protein
MGNKKLVNARAMKSAITNHKRFNEALIRKRLRKTSKKFNNENVIMQRKQLPYVKKILLLHLQ